MTLKDKILSPQNIYTAIYSMETYVFEKGLLSKSDLDLYNQLTDKYNDEVIKEVICKCQEKILEVLKPDILFDVQVYFKLKKYDDDTDSFVFRPIHTSDLISQISMVSMLLPLMYNDEGDKREFSELAKLVPHNFYGNVPSEMVDSVFIKWQHKYKQYSESIIHKSKEYKETKQYKYEVCLDIKDFFPSIDPCYIYETIVKLLAPLYRDADLQTLKLVLSRLLYFRIHQDNLVGWKDAYYPGIDTANWDAYITRGVAQGLPQSYFFGNICMVCVADEIKNKLDGDAYYYVDDSVVFTNNIADTDDFEKIITCLNGTLERKIIGHEKCEECVAYLPNDLKNVATNIQYKVQFNLDKSFYNSLEDGADNTGGLQYLSRQVSMAAALSNNLDDDEDAMSLDKLSKLLKVIEHELKELKNKEDANKNDIKLLKRHRKYFLFRMRLLNLKAEGEVNNTYWEEFIRRFQIEGEVDGRTLSDVLDEDIFQSESRLIITNSPESEWEQRYDVITTWEKKLAPQKTNLYYVKDLSGARDYSQLSYITYASLIKGRRKTMRLEASLPETKKWEIIKRRISKWHEKQSIATDYASFVRKASNEYCRKYYNAVFSYIYNVEISDRLNFTKIDNRCVTYTELRILAYLRNRNFRQIDFENFLYDVYDHQDIVLGNMHIDMAILEVLHILITTVKDPQHVDDIILTHRVVSAMWKNGSKFLNAYTLHNEDHAICLIKQCKKILSAIDYLGIKKEDYYILFLACYLHDISMVIHPNLNQFNSGDAEANRIVTDNRLKYIEASSKPFLSYHELLIGIFNDIYGYFENKKRVNHPKESATYVRHHKKDFFNYLSSSVVELVAKISESHGYDSIDVYGRKSDAKSELFSLKYMMILIRLADLMDMSNDRVNYYRLRESLTSLSERSRFHWISHLVTDKAQIRSTYEYDEDKRLWECPLTETVHVDLFLNVSYMASLVRNAGCESCQAKYLGRSLSDIGKENDDLKNYEVVRIEITDGIQCDAAEKGACPIICAWMQKKNSYLASELNSLCLYLNKVNTRLFTTKFEIDLIFDDTHKLDSDMFDCVHSYLKKELN